MIAVVLAMPTARRLAGSNGAYDANVNNVIESGRARDAIQWGGAGWPTDVEFSNKYKWGAGVPSNIMERYYPKSP